MNITRKSMFISLGLLWGMLSPVSVQAECVQSELAGTWYIYAPAMLRCKVKVNSSGTIVASKSKCSFRDETGRYSGNIAGGNMSISSGCKVTGKMKVCGDGCESIKIEHGRLERDKNMIILEAYVPGIDPTGTLSFVGAKK